MDHLVLRAGRRGRPDRRRGGQCGRPRSRLRDHAEAPRQGAVDAQTTGALTVSVVRESAINRVIFRLESDDVRIVPRRGLRRLLLTAIWCLAAPFRIGSPRLWVAVDRRTAGLGRAVCPGRALDAGRPGDPPCRRPPASALCRAQAGERGVRAALGQRLESQGQGGGTAAPPPDSPAAAAVATPASSPVTRERSAGVGGARRDRPRRGW